MEFLVTFIILSIINVVFSTIRSITTIKSGKTIASLISGGYFAFYNVMLIYTVADFAMWQKCLITFVCNVLGVYIVKLVEEKMRKDRLWKIEFSYKGKNSYDLAKALREKGISTSYIELNNGYTQLTSWCKTQEETKIVSQFIKDNNCKYFITESRYSL